MKATLLFIALGLGAQEASPPLKPVAAQQLERAIASLRNSNATTRAKTEAEVVAFGRGAIPMLVAAAHTTHAGQQAGLAHCLLQLTDERDSELVAECLGSERVALRRFAAHKAGDLGHVVPLRPLLEDEDDIVRFETALSLARNGHEEGIEILAEKWEESGVQSRARTALAGLVGKGRHEALGARLLIDKKLEKSDPQASMARRLTAVQMLSAIADPPSILLLARALDDPHNLVQRAAIDMLRALVEHSGPFQGASIFQQINEVRRLKEMLKAQLAASEAR